MTKVTAKGATRSTYIPKNHIYSFLINLFTKIDNKYQNNLNLITFYIYRPKVQKKLKKEAKYYFITIHIQSYTLHTEL